MNERELIARQDLWATLHIEVADLGRSPSSLGFRDFLGGAKLPGAAHRNRRRRLETEALRLVAHPGWKFARLTAGGRQHPDPHPTILGLVDDDQLTSKACGAGRRSGKYTR